MLLVLNLKAKISTNILGKKNRIFEIAKIRAAKQYARLLCALCNIQLPLYLTSDLRPSRDVKMPRMELRPTSLASSGSWDEYCSKSFRIFTARWMV